MAINENMEMNRSRYIGGSDIPRLLGESKFGKPKDLLFEKFMGQREVFDNIYVKMGNYFEPRIQEYFDVINVDDKEWTLDKIDGVDLMLPIKCHVDGLHRETGQLIEIKNSKSGKEDLIKEYFYQVQTYMWVLDLQECTLINLRRQGEVNTSFRHIMLELGIPFMHNFLDMENGEEKSKQCDELISSTFDELDLEDKHFDVIKIERDEKAIAKIREAVLFFDTHMKRLDVENIEEFCSSFQSEILGYHTLDEAPMLTQNQIDDIEVSLESLLEQKKVIDAEIKELKETLKHCGLDKVRIGNMLFTQKPASVRKTLNMEKLIEQTGLTEDQLAECYDEKTVAGRVTFSKL